MVFSSIVFLLYFLPAFLTIYVLADRKYKNAVILVSSIVFYSWGAPKFIFVILGTTLVDFYLVRTMDNATSVLKRKLLLAASLSINLGLLFYFKYAEFFVENINAVSGHLGMGKIPLLHVLLPIGISFYTFETITYVMDVYRRVHKPLDNFWEYQLYIIFFPKLIAGPIIRYHELADQITGRYENETNHNRLAGFYRFAWGLSKKVMLANPAGMYADQIMGGDFSRLDMPTAWIGILAYTMQIYFDFSGYSDMAIGIGRMVGFTFPENFNNPYISKSITEFWRRWHMTLGAWMKNYLYIPLGGNRVSSSGRLYFNLWLVFLASGFWHGASWNFILWGAFHGMFLVLERAWLLKAGEKIPGMIRTAATFIIVMIGWVFFRIESFDGATTYLGRMCSGSLTLAVIPERGVLIPLFIAVMFAFAATTRFGNRVQSILYMPADRPKHHLILFPVALLFFTGSVAMIAGSHFNPFIYFRF